MAHGLSCCTACGPSSQIRDRMGVPALLGGFQTLDSQGGPVMFPLENFEGVQCMVTVFSSASQI